MLLMFVFILLQPNFAFAQAPTELDNSPISRGLCNVFELVGGNIGKSLAIFAIVMVGFGFFTGKFSIALVIGITLGIGILFGAPKIIAALTGERAVNCSDVTEGGSIACPTEIGLSRGGQSISQHTSSDKSFILSSGNTQLAKIECYTASGNQTRVKFTPLVHNRATRIEAINTFITSLGGMGTQALGDIIGAKDVSSPITSDAFPTGTSPLVTLVANGFCPEIEANIRHVPNINSCNAPNDIVVATESGTTEGLCANDSKIAAAGSNPIGSSNFTIMANGLASTNTGGKLTITAGFIGDVRSLKISSDPREMIATCVAGSWQIKTSGGTDIAAANCIAGVCFNFSASANQAVSFSLKP